jgi:hypothetical protein
MSSANLLSLRDDYAMEYGGPRDPVAGRELRRDLIAHFNAAGRPILAAGIAKNAAKQAMFDLAGDPASAQCAREWLHNAVETFDQAGAIDELVETLQCLHELEFRAGDRQAAAYAGLQTLIASVSLEQGGVELGRITEISRSLRGLDTRVALLSMEMGETAFALEALELGRTRFLRSALRVVDLEQSEAQKGIRDTRAAVLALEEELGRTRNPSRAKLEEFIRLREKLASLLEASASAPRSTTWDRVKSLMSTYDAIVLPVFSAEGSLIIVLAMKDGDLLASVSKLSGDVGPVFERWREAYVDYDGRDPIRLGAAIESISQDLWELLGNDLAYGLHRRNVAADARVVIVPQGHAALLPLGLAGDRTLGWRLIDVWEISFAPSISALATSRAEPTAPTLAAIVNPTGDLPSTAVECAEVAARFSPGALAVVYGMKATKRAALDALRGASHWLFSTHAAFDSADARGSGLVLANGETLSIDDLLTAPYLGSPRLVVLSACETGLHDTLQAADEFVGLPVSFLQMGAGAVLASLWSVADTSTALLTSAFFHHHVINRERPAAALRRAQSWVAGATVSAIRAVLESASSPETREELRTEITRILSEFENLDPAAKPFEHPFYWGGFVLYGA